MSDFAIYRVTAHALNLRAAPARDAAKLGVMPSGATVTRIGQAPDAGWMQVAWNGLQGYAASTFLQLQSSAASLTGAPAPSLVGVPPAPSVEARDRLAGNLHPVVREAVDVTLKILNERGAPFRLFEGYRTPERQAHLYAQGRTRPGGKVTNAQPWQSYHQYGLACDLVLFENGAWSWDASGGKAKHWDLMQKVAAEHNLRTLSFERPHVEYAGPRWQDLQLGRGFPDGGDDTWLETVTLAAQRWKAAGRSPLAPPLQYAERPELPHDAA